MTSSLNLNNIIQHPFPDNQYIKEEYPKKQIYLHHTAGGSNGISAYKFWESNTERVATCVVISGATNAMPDGQIVQGFPSKYWSYHLGLTDKAFRTFNIPYQSLDKISIGIELCNWGILKKTDRGFESWAQVIVPEKDVCVLDRSFKGSKYYHNYTDAQIESVRQLLVYWNSIYDIPLTYKEDIFNVTPRALRGESGVYTHNSVRKDKTDIYPHPKIIKMLQSL